MKLTKKITEVKLIETDHGYAVEMDLTPEEMFNIFDAKQREYIAEDIDTQLDRMVENETITQEQKDAFLADEESVQEVISETVDEDVPESYWYGIEWEILRRIDM